MGSRTDVQPGHTGPSTKVLKSSILVIINRHCPKTPIAWHLVSPGLPHNPAAKGLSLAHLGSLFRGTCAVLTVQYYEHH